MSNVQINGLDAVVRKIDALNKPGAFRRPMLEATQYIQDNVAKYPPATSANSPSNKQWYERGFGTRYRRRDGSVVGRQTSQTLGRRWTSSVTTDGRTGKVGNNATYAKFVQGDEQAAFHKRRGWVNAPEWANDHSRQILAFFERHYKRLID